MHKKTNTEQKNKEKFTTFTIVAIHRSLKKVGKALGKMCRNR
jgi:hypothetical protein